MAERDALRILVVDDDPAMVRLAATALMAHGFTDLEHVATGREALLAAARADVLLLDQNLPDLAGREVLLALRAWPDPPSVVMVTAHGSETFAAEALRAGADDYLVKDASLAAMLPEVVERVRRTRSLREALAAAEQELLHVERRAAVGAMTVTLHHEINNPLMAASAELELLLGGGEPLSATQRASLDTVRGHAGADPGDREEGGGAPSRRERGIRARRPDDRPAGRRRPGSSRRRAAAPSSWCPRRPPRAWSSRSSAARATRRSGWRAPSRWSTRCRDST